MVIRILIILLFTPQVMFAQNNERKVESITYSIMLKALLSHSVQEIGVSEVDTLTEPVFLDARGKEEFEVSHINGAKWIGYETYDSSSVTEIPKHKPIVVYCSVGYRSEKVAEKLLKQGFTSVYNLYGGIFEWVNRGGVVVDSTNFTDNVHAYNKTWGIWLKKGKKVYGK